MSGPQPPFPDPTGRRIQSGKKAACAVRAFRLRFEIRLIRLFHNFSSLGDTAHETFKPIEGINPLKLNCPELSSELFEAFLEIADPP